MIHNVIEVDGLEYKAVNGKGRGACEGCAFSHGYKVKECRFVVDKGVCSKFYREDNADPIYKRHYKLKDCK